MEPLWLKWIDFKFRCEKITFSNYAWSFVLALCCIESVFDWDLKTIFLLCSYIELNALGTHDFTVHFFRAQHILRNSLAAQKILHSVSATVPTCSLCVLSFAGPGSQMRFPFSIPRSLQWSLQRQFDPDTYNLITKGCLLCS